MAGRIRGMGVDDRESSLDRRSRVDLIETAAPSNARASWFKIGSGGNSSIDIRGRESGRRALDYFRSHFDYWLELWRFQELRFDDRQNFFDDRCLRELREKRAHERGESFANGLRRFGVAIGSIGTRVDEGGGDGRHLQLQIPLRLRLRHCDAFGETFRARLPLRLSDDL